MSAINDALSRLARDNAPLKSELRQAQVPAVKQRSIVAWVIGSFCLSLAVGGWAISQQVPLQSNSIEQPESVSLNELQSTSQATSQSTSSQLISPTSQVTEHESPVYQTAGSQTADSNVAPKKSNAAPKKQRQAKQNHPIKKVKTATATKAIKVKTAESVNNSAVSKPILVAAVTKTQTADANQGEVVIEQVELTPQQLAEKAEARAAKALENNNLSDALKHYQESLRYTPSNKQVRKRLAALYYGKGELRKAADLLQKGIILDKNDTALRLALAKMLLKEQQNSAALTVLTALPSSASVDYLSLRAALAQKQKQNLLALQSYQQLVQREPQSGRWWMGLAIQQERALQLAKAKDSYTQALSRLGLSSQSQQFIHDRLSLIERLQEQPSEN